MESARFKLTKQPKVMALPPTSAKIMQHMLRAHLQVMLWKAAEWEGPTDEPRDNTNVGWMFRYVIPVPVNVESDLTPPDVIQCQCQAQGKKCSTEAYVCSGSPAYH